MPLLIEDIHTNESAESFIERHYKHDNLHRCRALAEFNVDAIAAENGASLVRSAQELELNPNGEGLRPQWTLLVFRRPANVFWHFLIKSINHSPDGKEREYTLTVTAESPEMAATEALTLQKRFTGDDTTPGFFMVSDLKKPRRIPLKPEYALSESMLDLHYGPGFAKWTEQFGKGLAQNGLSILRGKPGTGKTSFLRHLIFKHAETHRFYYLPVDSFGLLQSKMAAFLERERRRFKEAVLVLVLEDAEQLLLDRRGFRDGLASSLLNFTDGFVGDMVKAHLVCTINSEVKDLDEAVLRPGRQRFFHEFDLIDHRRACALAEKLGISLAEERAYSLAEIYHFKDLANTDGMAKHAQIGFATRG